MPLPTDPSRMIAGGLRTPEWLVAVVSHPALLEEEAMPVYQYECAPCQVVYDVLHGMNDPPLEICPKCGGAVTRLISAPRLNRYNFSGPTEAKYAKVSPREEVAKERELQRVYERIWLPPPVKHEPWD